MSPRRKSGLSPEDLQALKHLPAVIRALENLQEQHAKVRALMSSTPTAASWLPPEVRAEVEKTATKMFWEWRDAQGRAHSAPVDGRPILNAGAEMREHVAPTANIITDERREYEAAKKAGKEVPPDLANISDAQRERMAEQKALVQQMRRAKGLPVASEVEPVTEEQIIRTEELPTSESGSVGGEEDPEVH